MSDTAILLVRSALLSMSGLLMGITLVVAIMFFRAWRQTVNTPRSGLLPFHVWTIALSYDLLLASATVEVLIRVNADAHPSWRLFVLTPAYVLGITAMYAVLRLQRARKLATQNPSPELDAPADSKGVQPPDNLI